MACVLDRGSVRCVKASVLGCCAFSVLCQGKSVWLLCVVQCAVLWQECLAVARLVCFAKARVLSSYAFRQGPKLYHLFGWHASSVLCDVLG